MCVISDADIYVIITKSLDSIFNIRWESSRHTGDLVVHKGLSSLFSSLFFFFFFFFRMTRGSVVG
jgi:hypothetical protein